MRKTIVTIIETLIFLCGILAIVFVVLIFGFLLKEGFLFFKEFGVVKFITGKFWYPTSDPAQFGILPLIVGSIYVTIGACIIAVPLGIMAALYISEIAPRGVRDVIKILCRTYGQFQAVIGFCRYGYFSSAVRTLFDIPTDLAFSV